MNIQKRYLFVSTLLTLLSLSGCVTPIKSVKSVQPYDLPPQINSAIKMDFIGYKIDTTILSTSATSKSSPTTWAIETVMSEFDQAKAIAQIESLKKLGYILENSGIAEDKSSSYFGIYSLQEMELYKSKHPYVTFVEVAQSKLLYEENKRVKSAFGAIAGSLIAVGLPIAITGASYKNSPQNKDIANPLMGMGIGFSIGGLIAAIPALTPSKTDVTFSGVYNIYIYDSQKKAIIRKDAVSVNYKKKFDGSYSYDDASKEIVTNYTSRIVANEILKKYNEINLWLNRQ